METETILKSMINFIKNHAQERVAAIDMSADHEFTIEKEDYIGKEKDRIEQDIKDRLRKDEVNLRIERSKFDNAQRIDNMKETDKLIQKLYKDARLSIVKKQQADLNAYRELIKDLIVQVYLENLINVFQGLIRLMEPEVNIRCRKSDKQLVERVIDTAAAEYKKLMKENVKSYANKDVPLQIILDEGKYLPEFNEKGETATESCMGGIILHAKRGRIVCSNTLDERLQLVYSDAIPEIREKLFPCLALAKPEKPQKEVAEKHGHKH